MTPAEIARELGRALPGVTTRLAGPATVCVDVGSADWVAALACAAGPLDCRFFDWLTGVDDEEEGLRVVAHVYSLTGRHHVLVSTRLPRGAPRLPSVTGIYRGAAWHERETAEMFGIGFDDHPAPGPLLLPDGFRGHPLRKDFPLTARAGKEWPGSGEPGGGPPRRRLPPPGVAEGWRPA